MKPPKNGYATFDLEHCGKTEALILISQTKWLEVLAEQEERMKEEFRKAVPEEKNCSHWKESYPCVCQWNSCRAEILNRIGEL